MAVAAESEERKCKNCRYYGQSEEQYPCSECRGHDKFEPRPAQTSPAGGSLDPQTGMHIPLE